MFAVSACRTHDFNILGCDFGSDCFQLIDDFGNRIDAVNEYVEIMRELVPDNFCTLQSDKTVGFVRLVRTNFNLCKVRSLHFAYRHMFQFL